MVGIHQLDRLCSLFSPATSVAQHKRIPPRVEITSPRTNDGKSQFLYLIVAIGIIPKTYQGLPLGGQNTAVLYFDCHGSFDIERLVKVSRTYIARMIPAAPIADVDDMIDYALQHLHVFSPQSAEQFLQTLEHLQSYLFETPSRHYSSHRRIHSMILDSMTTFYWTDRDDAERANIPSRVADVKKGPKSDYPALKSMLSRLSSDLSCPIIYTSTNYFHKPDVATPTIRSLSSSLPHSWATFPTLRLLIQKREVRGFPVAISAEESVREANDRNQVVAQGWFDLTVNEDGSEDWSGEVVEEMHRTGRGKMAVRITNEGVEVVS